MSFIERTSINGGGAYQIGKSKVGIGQSVPLYGPGLLSKADMQSDAAGVGDGGHDIDWSEYSDEPTHRHFGHVEDHPVRLRHRKESTDHLHGDEDKLVDEYKALASKAKMGGCTPEEMNTLKMVRGRMLELNSRRVKDARAVHLGREMVNASGPVQGDRAAMHTSYSGHRSDQQGGSQKPKVVG